MTLDTEIRALERTVLVHPGDSRAQVALARALDGAGRSDDALEAYLRAQAADPRDPHVDQELGRVTWWSSPRGDPGGTRAAPVAPLAAPATVTWANAVGSSGLGLAVDRGRVYARVLDRSGRSRLVALALHDGTTLWSSDDDVTDAGGAAAPLAQGGFVYDAALLAAGHGVALSIRARDGATGASRWTHEQSLARAQRGAAFECVTLAPGRIVLAIGPQGRLTFDPLVRVIDAENGATQDAFELRGLSDLAASSEHLYLAAAHDRIDRRVEARALADGSRVWTAAHGTRVLRVVRGESMLVLALESGLLLLDPATGAPQVELPFRLLGDEALVVTPRLIVGAWSRRAGVMAVDPVTGNVLWRDEPPARVLAAADGVVYGVSSDATSLYALDLSSGERLVTVDLARVRQAAWTASLAATGQLKLAAAPRRVVGLTKEGVAFAVAPDPRDGIDASGSP